MTKEQEVIEHIEKRIKICNENADICDDNDFDEEATYLREESYILETVLNMLKEKDEETEHYKKKNKDLSKQLLMLYKEQDNYNARIEKKNEELKRKDKIIDLMARAIDNYDSQLVINIFKDKEHVKEYFERKVKE